MFVLLTAEVFPGFVLCEHLLLTCSTGFICTLFSYFCVQVFFQCHYDLIHHSIDLFIRQSFSLSKNVKLIAIDLFPTAQFLTFKNIKQTHILQLVLFLNFSTDTFCFFVF